MVIFNKIGPILDNKVAILLSKYTNPKDDSYINFGWGNLSTDMIKNNAPKGNIFSKEVINHYDSSVGLEETIELTLDFINKNTSKKVDAKNIIITNGATNGLFLLAYYFSAYKKIKNIIVQNPSFDTALNIFRSQAISLIPTDIGFTDKLPAKTKLVYGMFKLHNPTGHTVRAKAAIKIKKQILKTAYLIDDDAYGLLMPNSRIDLIRHKRYIYVGSFSKYIFPGLRLGYIIADMEIIDTLKIIQKYFNSHPNVLSQCLLIDYLKNNKIKEEIAVKRVTVSEKRQAFENNLSKKARNLILNFDGGFYYWFQLPNNTNWNRMYLEILNKNIFVMPGEVYSLPPRGKAFRVCISSLSKEKIIIGAKLLSKIIDQYVE